MSSADPAAVGMAGEGYIFPGHVPLMRGARAKRPKVAQKASGTGRLRLFRTSCHAEPRPYPERVCASAGAGDCNQR